MNEKFSSAWDALETDPIQAENLKLRAQLMISINRYIDEKHLKQVEAAKLLHVSQPRVNALLQGKINDFRLDTLVNMAHRLGFHVNMQIAA